MSLQVRVENQQHQPLAGAMVLIADDEQIYFTAANGTATVPAREGVHYVFTFLSGFRAQVKIVSMGPGNANRLTMTLEPGEILVGDVTAIPLTPTDLVLRGVQLDDPENFQVFDFTVFLNIVPEGILIPNVILPRQPTAGTVVDIPLASASESSTGGGNQSGPGAGINRPLVAGRLLYLSETQRVETWIVIPGEVRLLKQFWEATITIRNSAQSIDPNLIQLIDVQARLERSSNNLALPDLDGQAQAITQSAGNIPAGGTATTKWVLRGDASGLYKLSATINAELQFGSNPNQIGLQTDTRQTTVAIYQPALAVTYRAPSQVVAGQPFDMELVVTNATPIALNEITLKFTAPMTNAHLAQGESPVKYIGSLTPQQQKSVRLRLVSEVTGCVNIPASFVAADREISPRLRFVPSDCAQLPAAPLTCLYYDFTIGEHKFSPRAVGLGTWPNLTGGQGWASVSGGAIEIRRGIDNVGPALFYTSTVPRLPEPGFDAELLERSVQNGVPLEQIRLEYAWIADPPESPLPASSVLNAEFELLVPDGAGTKRIRSARQFTPDEPTSWAEGNEERFVGILPVSEADRSSAVRPSGLRLRMQTVNTAELIRLKRVGFCFDVEPTPALPLPPEAEAACDMLLANLSSESRKQPFGQFRLTQPEFPFLEEDAGSVSLEPYPEYRLNAEVPGYPRQLTYTGLAADPAYALIPCVFMQDGEFYNPDSTEIVQDETGAFVLRPKPIVRFAAVGPDPNLRDWLVLLNYAAYFAVGSKTWCYGGDNVFGSFYHDRGNFNGYGPGYNVPPPSFDCRVLEATGSGYGPCGSFVSALYRALGYYRVDAFADALVGEGDGPVFGLITLERTRTVNSLLGNLYYGPLAYTWTLPQNGYGRVNRPFVRVDPTQMETYTQVPVTFSGLRISRIGQTPGPIVVTQNPLRCNSEDAGCQAAIGLAGGNWHLPFAKSISPLHKGPAVSPDALWERVKPGDLVITVIETTNGPFYSHIAVVVGWGPKVSAAGPGTDSVAFNTRYGREFYPTFDSIPFNRENYVPYVLDRSASPNTGKLTGPRPFNYQQMHTAIDIWVAEPQAGSQP
jgi:hypothetical protein